MFNCIQVCYYVNISKNTHPPESFACKTGRGGGYNICIINNNGGKKDV